MKSEWLASEITCALSVCTTTKPHTVA